MFFGTLTGAVIGQMVPPGLDSERAPLESLYYTVGFAVLGAILGMALDPGRSDD